MNFEKRNLVFRYQRKYYSKLISCNNRITQKIFLYNDYVYETILEKEIGKTIFNMNFF